MEKNTLTRLNGTIPAKKKRSADWSENKEEHAGW